MILDDMAQSENPVGALAAIFILVLVALAIFNVSQGGSIDGTILGWFTDHPEIFAGVIIFLLFINVILSVAQEL